MSEPEGKKDKRCTMGKGKEAGSWMRGAMFYIMRILLIAFSGTHDQIKRIKQHARSLKEKRTEK